MNLPNTNGSAQGGLNRPHPSTHFIAISRKVGHALMRRFGVEDFNELRSLVVHSIAERCDVVDGSLEWHFFATTEIQGQELVFACSSNIGAPDPDTPFTTVLRGIFEPEQVPEGPPPRLSRGKNEEGVEYTQQQAALENATLYEIEARLTEIETTWTTTVARRAEVQAELGALNRRVRGRTLPQREYGEVVEQQDRLKRKVARIERFLMELKAERIRLTGLKSLREREMRESRQEEKQRRADMYDQVKALRDKYLDFSADQTRVNSMRIVASQVAEDLTALLGD